MTREKAILVLDSLSTWLGYERPITEEIVEAIKTLSNFFLPSDLDDTAEKYAKGEGLENALGGWEDMSDAFKAGAEWQANQGASYETVISADKTIPILPMKDVSEMGFDYGDKVVVQIRKK